MSRTFAGPLEGRPNRSSWANLLALALPALDHAMPGEREAICGGGIPRWTLGGGTALALRIGHRTSDDIDVFLSGVRLAEMTPARNPLAKKIGERFQWPGYYLKFERPEGEVDFLGSPLQTMPGFDLQTFHGRTVALETVDEVMAKKLRYRAAHFTDRDGFDLACVLRIRPEVTLTLAAEVGDTLSRARLALEGGDPDRIRARIRDPGPEFEDILKDPITEALKALGTIERERDNPLSAVERERVQAVAREASHIEPGTSRGAVRVDWFEADADREEAHLACVRSAPLAAKAAVLSEWRRRDPGTFEAWDARNRPGAPETGRIRDRSRDGYGL